MDNLLGPADDNVTVGRSELVRLKADLAYTSRLLTSTREVLATVHDALEDEGDRVYFGSSNHADQFKELYRQLDDWSWEEIINEGVKLPDVYAEMRDLRRQAESDLGIELLYESHAAFGNRTAEHPSVPIMDDFDYSRLLFWAGELAKIAALMKIEAAEANGTGRTELALWLIRVQLSTEETGEFAEALATQDMRKIAKELVDISYVTDGHYIALGLGALKQSLYKEVHRSNMTKLGPDGKPIISDAGRWVKGPNYQHADLGPILDAK